VLFATEIKDEERRPAAQRAVQEIQLSLDRIEAEALTAGVVVAYHHQQFPAQGMRTKFLMAIFEPARARSEDGLMTTVISSKRLPRAVAGI